MVATDWIQFGALMVALVALFFQMRETNRLGKLENFRSYTQRYQAILMTLPIQIISKDFDLDALNPADREQVLRSLRAYYDLCSEEFYLRKSGHLDARVWDLWSAGMKCVFGLPAFRAAWDEVQEYGYYDGKFAQFVIGIRGRIPEE